MDTLGIEQAMKQCWEQVWPAVRAEVSQGVNVASGLVVMQKLMKLMRGVCVAGFRAWLEQADCSDDTREQDGRQIVTRQNRSAVLRRWIGPVVRAMGGIAKLSAVRLKLADRVRTMREGLDFKSC